MICPSCGKENKEDAKFCKNCGEKLSPSPHVASRAASTTVGSEKKSNRNLIIVCATAIVCVLIVAMAFVYVSVTPTEPVAVDDAVDSSSVSALNSYNSSVADDDSEDSDSQDQAEESDSANEYNKNHRWGKSFYEAYDYFPEASEMVFTHVFYEADLDGNGFLNDSEYKSFKSLVSFTKKYAADIKNDDYVDTPDLWEGDGTTRTRYCADHGRIAVGSDNRCPYCQRKGQDSRTKSGSTRYV